MDLSVIKPSSNLKDIVKNYVVVKSLDEYEKLWVLPGAGNFILFNPGLEAYLHKYNSDEMMFTLPTAFSIGVKANDIVRFKVEKDDDIRYPLLAVELMPTGFNRLFNKNAYDLRSGHVLLSECIKDMDISFSALYSLGSVDEQIAYIEKRLLFLKEKPVPLHVESIFIIIEEIIQYMLDTLLNVNVATILEKFDYSRTSLERDFKRIVGYTPKEFIQMMRFCSIFKELIENGYDYRKLKYEFFDQSHMNKTFKKFIDIPPSKLQDYILANKIQIYQTHE